MSRGVGEVDFPLSMEPNGALIPGIVTPAEGMPSLNLLSHLGAPGSDSLN